jgi:hypothetical protein
MPRQRYVPINHRIQDLCYDFLPEHRMNAGYKSCLPDDAQEIYEPFDNREKNFFEDGRRMFFSANENPANVFGQEFCNTGGKGEVREECLHRPDGSVVKKRTVTTYEEMEPPLNEEELRAEKKRKEEEAKERARKMTPIEIMFATQAALKETMNRAQDTSKKAFETGIDVIRLAGACGVDLGDEARTAKTNEAEAPVETKQELKDYSSSAPRDVKINVQRRY